ncbi:MAG: hypothetical protein HZA04_06290 [Nitrospinae bacterium]|nr:hypothetical protein [Nitrospinota bacterium]
MIKVIHAESMLCDGKLAVRYVYSDGKERIRVGGQPAFRNSNPGNMAYSPYIRTLGAIGKDENGRAIFPDWATGEKAMQRLLKEGMYRSMNIRKTIEAWAPKNNNNTEAYIRDVVKSSGLPETAVIGKMSDPEFKRFRDAMKKHEDSTPGYDLMDLGKPGQDDWFRIDYKKTDGKLPDKDFNSYAPNKIERYGKSFLLQPPPPKTVSILSGIHLPLKGVPNDRKSKASPPSSATNSKTPSHSHSGETLERHGDQVYRIEGDGKTRGSFNSP